MKELQFTGKWLLLILLIGSLTGSVVAAFLYSLDFVTQFRISHFSVTYLLPLAGLLIGLSYYYYGKDAVKGNNLIKEEIYNPTQIIPLRMAILIFFSTLLTHLCGGAAGREGTAVQLGSTIADRFTKWFQLSTEQRKIILIMGISAGFSAVFNTPLAATIFAFEVLAIPTFNKWGIIPVFIVAFVAQFCCNLYPIHHTHYAITTIPKINLKNLFFITLSAISFGITAFVFTKFRHFFSSILSSIYPPIRPFLGGIIIVLCLSFFEINAYVGLGIPMIEQSFLREVPAYSFLLKIILTTFTLGVGFKGGEVTPLFFIGATLGNLLSFYLPLPMALLAGAGFVSVFSGATNTPIACTIMGLELFGPEGFIYLSIGCFVSFLCSGKKGIYTAQKIHFIKEIITANFTAIQKWLLRSK